ncbi:MULTISPECIES: DUF2089 family protein [unclassified Lactococcus]|uniref:DUF2089 family protein n=1 Tax=unclassified Lactococcus TaxID=2643510 RepID=UPI0011CA590B|nr:MULTISPECIES: DUF2089 family protein [unclassified Lactococcus]MQW23957.1 DUF2089 family protein [Lactococcus sp. dk101]TXK36980.1 DUF2089 domain-containing protein [Lactococcus sp. dk310]TXK47605.1 DUF2089 domain-containing protein [Lactococcus sp. dk322]
MKWYLNLEDEDLEFIKNFVLASGSLKELAKQYDVSYPTVRLRVDKVIEQIKLLEGSNNVFEVKIMQLVIDEKITLDTAKDIIKIHKEDKK